MQARTTVTVVLPALDEESSASVAQALVSGDPRFLLLKNSVVTGAVGLVFLGTTLFGTPLTLAASQSFQPDRKAELRKAYETDPHVRRGHRLSSAVWGVGLILEALVRVPLVFLLPIDVMVALGEVLTIAVIGGLLAWNIWYVKRATARVPPPRPTERRTARSDT